MSPGSSPSHPVLLALGGVAAAGVLTGAATTAYAVWEARQYELRHVQVPVLPPRSEPLSLLHISDLHLSARDTDRARWVASLADLNPDLVVATGDFLGAVSGFPLLRTALEPLLTRPGAFVFGSNDFYPGKPISPAKYLRGPSKRPRREPELPTAELRDWLVGAGWLDLNNGSGSITLNDELLSFLGSADPHMRVDDYASVAGGWAPGADLRIGVVHAPYLRVLDAMVADVAQLILAGHTHGGQVCLPGYGTLVTNCDLDRARARGLSRYEEAWLNVSAGLGTNPYAPIRVACRPEATLLELVEVHEH